MSVYAIAVFQRSSLGVAGLAAAAHFHAGPAALSLFTILQLSVYALMQVPVGLLADRVGPRRMLATGLMLMAVGQLGVALSDQLAGGIAARVLVGAGDAMSFVSLLRLISAWFPAHRCALMTQLTSLAGMVGNLASVLPMSALLHAYGWTPTFLANAGVAAVMLLPVVLLLRDRPGGRRTAGPIHTASVRRQLAESWAQPGTRLGTWTHMCTQFSSCVFGLLWGFPFLIKGEGLHTATAGVLLTVLVLAGAALAQVFGVVSSRWPTVRHRLALGVVVTTMFSWTIVLLWSPHVPLPVLVVHIIVLSAGGPASMLGFEHAREANPPQRAGTASGLVNIGGFSASVVAMLLIGLALQVFGGLGATAYTIAFALQFLLFAVGLRQMVRYGRLVAAVKGRAPQRTLRAIPVGHRR
ncbi:MFS transporter [Fodinicola feengrottensis]